MQNCYKIYSIFSKLLQISSLYAKLLQIFSLDAKLLQISSLYAKLLQHILPICKIVLFLISGKEWNGYDGYDDDGYNVDGYNADGNDTDHNNDGGDGDDDVVSIMIQWIAPQFYSRLNSHLRWCVIPHYNGDGEQDGYAKNSDPTL